MRLKSYEYSQYSNSPRSWMLSGLTLGPINLIVGKNAAGKSRTLNTIKGLGELVSGLRKPSSMTTGTYDVTFEHDGRTLRYFLDISDHKVTSEIFSDGDTVLLRRGSGGAGTIFHEKENADIQFQTPEGEVAVVARRDSIQHGFLEPLGQWGEGVRSYAFGQQMGQGSVMLFAQNGPAPDPRDVNTIVGLFRKGAKEFGERFEREICDGMNAIGYSIKQVGVMPSSDFSIVTIMPMVGGPIEPSVLFVLEEDVPCPVQQHEMSQGMFRALSTIILIAYAAIVKRPSCVLIDDLGEGLDFERSCKLIDLMRQRAGQCDLQLIVSTNDKFIMNQVPLDEWSVVKRQGSHVTIRNHENSREEFERFKFVGMSNFSFFEMDFLDGARVMEAESAHE